MQIERELFEAWLFSQPPERQFYYYDTNGCAIASFLREALGIQRPRVGGMEFDDAEGKGCLLPQWLRDIVFPLPIHFTVAQLRRRYLELFPDTFIATEPAPNAQPESKL